MLAMQSAMPQNPLSLSDAIEIGLRNNYDLQITRRSEEIAGINNTWGNTGIMPRVNFTLSGMENFNFNNQEDYRTQNLSPDVNLNWVFFDGFSAIITKQKFEELEKQSQGNTVILVESTIQDIILAYNNCLLQKEMADVYNELADLSLDRYKREQDSEQLGASTTYESLQAKTAWLEDQSNYLQQKVNYENAVRTLNYILAVDNDMVWVLTSDLAVNTPDYALNDLAGKLMGNNQNLKNQYLYQSLLARETALVRSNRYPTLSLNTGVSNNWMDNYYAGNIPDMNQEYASAYIGLTLSWNIFNGGITNRSMQIAKINEESAGIMTEQMEHSLNNQLLQLYSDYQVQKDILVLADEKLAAASLNLELSEAKLKNGSINSFNYRDVQNIYMNAALTRFVAIYSLIRANTDLLRITGGIISEYR